MYHLSVKSAFRRGDLGCDGRHIGSPGRAGFRNAHRDDDVYAWSFQ